MKKLSLVICVFNEEQNIKPLSGQIQAALADYDFEAVFVDDGSTDKTCSEIKKINDDRFILVELKMNYGQSSALQAGIDQAEGEFVVLLDGDLQNDPADIPAMLKMMELDEWDMVAGVRANRRDGMFLRKIPSKIANFMIRKSTGIHMKDLGCTLKIFTKETIKSIHIYGELHRYIPALITLEGATKITQVDVNHRARKFGNSKYNLSRTTKVISDLILMVFFKKYLQRPMHFFGAIGIITFGIGVLINFYMLILKILGNDIWGKPLLLLGILLVMGGIQFITIGIIAELQMRTYFESQRKKPYRIKKISSTVEK
ncbi:MAG: glycosyltransferase family 2 protein [Prolixibacteraceae bacterium]|jgi:glycosyltransferase involved in cell wall biosynthesis|nr:glycosyltransferase family 2 protein [Prolixibacteraceae bacterium]MBT6766142.1 glycosyltransferase family 2 protein [Prolixibacteraceae bacterium]MBT6996932.1 glycosyltransferase family 2 protein [Prolixibacteraceae bacterium]MBT7395384.1 glycosyltransferase family 2 protein [Prolixibacteraceae bacterium]